MTNKTSKPLTTEDLDSYAGKNGDYYVRFLTRHQNTSTFLSWNWSAFFFLPYWLAYRKLWKPLVGITVLQFSIALLASKALLGINSDNIFQEPEYGFLLLFGWLVFASIVGIGITLLANSFYLQQAEKYITKSEQQKLTNAVHAKGQSVTALLIYIVGFSFVSGYLLWSHIQKEKVSYQQRIDSYTAPQVGTELGSGGELESLLSSEMLVLETELGDIGFYDNDYHQDLTTLLTPHEDISALNNSTTMRYVLERLMSLEATNSLQLMFDKKLDFKELEAFFEIDFLVSAHKDNKWKVTQFLVDKASYIMSPEHLMKPNGYDNERPLQYVVKNGDLAAVTWMLEQKIPVTAKYYKNNSPLILAVKAEQPKIVGLLLAYGANPNYKNPNGESAVSLALSSNDATISNLLKMKQ